MIDKIYSELKRRLKPSRYEHTLGVCKTAMELARIHGADEHKAELAALLHDIAKYESDETMLSFANEAGIELEEAYKASPNLLHGQYAAYLAKNEFGIEDYEILSAISCHTAGKANMSLLDKIIFIADIAEPGRRIFPGIKDIRASMQNNISRAMILAITSSVKYVMEKEQLIIKETVLAYNSIIAENTQKGT